MTEKYYKELARVLKGHNIETDKFEYDNMNVVHDGNIICNLLPNGGIKYETAIMENQDAAEIIEKVGMIAICLHSYVSEVEQASHVKSTSGNSDFKLIADFGGTILAGKETEIGGYQFATWEKDGSGKGYNYGHYFDSDYTAAKEDFALRANLIDRDKVFSEKEMGLIYKCMKSAMEDETLLSFTEEKIAEELCEQIENLYPIIKEQEQEQAIASPNMEQTM